MDVNIAEQTRIEKLPPKEWARFIFVITLIPAVLLLCGGDPAWWQAWVYLLLMVVTGLAGRIWAERRHPGLLAERVNFHKAPAAKSWDKVLGPLMALSLSFPLVITAGLDHRFNWTAPLPAWLTILGLFIIASGFAFGSWALVENRFFSGVVRIQADRGHRVCDSGPYRIVRHPGYLGNLLPLPGMVLAFSSLWTLIPAAAALAVAIVRTSLEDRTLQEELPGYREYARRVRWRLIPGLY